MHAYPSTLHDVSNFSNKNLYMIPRRNKKPSNPKKYRDLLPHFTSELPKVSTRGPKIVRTGGKCACLKLPFVTFEDIRFLCLMI